jgi:hypothetical protein
VKNKGFLFISKIKCAVRSRVHSIVGGALDHSLCARVHVIALKTHSVVGEAMAVRATQADEACARSHPLGLSALAGARSSPFVLFHPFNLSLNARTCNTVEH